MTQGSGPEAPERGSILPSDVSRLALPSGADESQLASDLTAQTEQRAGVQEALSGRGLSPEQVRKRARNQAFRRRKQLGLVVRRRSQSGKKHDSHKPLWSADQIREKLRTYDRTPFMDLLAAWLECSPTPEALVSFADRYPDRYASSLLSIGRIAGFAERREVTASLSGKIQVEHLSDSQLEDQLREMAYQMGIPLPKVLELQALPSGEASDAPSDPSVVAATPQGDPVGPRE